MKIFNYIEFIKENTSSVNKIPTYSEAVEMCSGDEAPFYESKYEVEGYPVSVFNYRLAQYKDFDTPVPSKPELKGFEMRGLTFVFNKEENLGWKFSGK